MYIMTAKEDILTRIGEGYTDSYALAKITGYNQQHIQRTVLTLAATGQITIDRQPRGYTYAIPVAPVKQE